MKQFEKTIYVSHKYGGDKTISKKLKKSLEHSKKTSELYVYFTVAYVWFSV